MKFLKRFGAILVKYDVDMINKVEYTFTFVIKKTKPSIYVKKNGYKSENN
jgi:hypothetical protein